MPDFRICGRFDGKTSAARWLSRLHWEFQHVGHGDAGTLPHNEVLQAVDMLCEGDAAVFLLPT